MKWMIIIGICILLVGCSPYFGDIETLSETREGVSHNISYNIAKESIIIYDIGYLKGHNDGNKGNSTYLKILAKKYLKD